MLIGLANRLNIAGAPAADLSKEEARFVDLLVRDLQKRGEKSLVAVGDTLPPWAHALAHRINAQLGAVEQTVSYVHDPHGDAPLHGEAIKTLTASMKAGDVQTLVILGGNPVYDAPADVPFGDALKKVETTIHLSLYPNETAAACAWRLPRAHYLEAWDDGRSWDGTITTAQPLIEPLYEGKTIAETLALITQDETTASYDLVRRTLADHLGGGDFETVWRRTLHAGVLADSAWKPVRPGLAGAPLSIPTEKPAGEFDVVFSADAGVYDGRFANNGWLQETPDPLTKVTWDNPLLINKADADRLGVTTGDVVKVDVNGRSLEIAAYVMPGQPKGVLGVALGYGRSTAGNVGTEVGFDAYTLRTSSAPHHAGGAKLTKTGATYVLALTQDHHMIDPVGAAGRDLRVGNKGESGSVIREASLKEYRKDPDFVHRDAHGNIHLQLFDPPSEFNDPHAWGMAVDMSACIGCNACVVACQAENNIPVVGKEEVERSREMQWLRIDRYFKGDPEENPDVVHQPMMCVHCENAPCEQVCPVAATTHDTEGLNTMVYNRCIGTRYCSNNCPYKVRRFNYFDFHSKDPRGAAQPWLGMPDSQQQAQVDEIKQMVFNPDVTVRMRGVMEKCTYCVQRISAAKIARRNAGEQVQDGDVVTACQQACPTQAIAFGDLNDPHSQVRKLHQNHRAYGVLASLNVRPRTKHLAIVRNPAEEQAEA